MKIKLQNR